MDLQSPQRNSEAALAIFELANPASAGSSCTFSYCSIAEEIFAWSDRRLWMVGNVARFGSSDIVRFDF